ncbi:MAG: UDP-glucose 6-dehydrogenase [Candidatus Komeilibacteria bacterium RIFCSPLOWO2_01_FULL_52_15]|uniref:UDP-glucose 6-dehydrogenase n=1 Tax=Candidatus Komeilibacteria bacterium RIFCSPLOWO2_01_FULL_52_15 TaxID=1798551 RepID=A0A1G2BMT4_9BACT|nr:MAG: UDP-glucose 6-dehydrogenase [Candidatus Komeilibacteria bacterium RIFCSPLOWO2_01_FULL_52_15]
MKVAVIGTGYVGLTVGACFAETGHEVICVDIDDRKIKGLKRGKLPIYEPGLGDLVERNTREKRLSFGTDTGDAIEWADVVFSAVGTPPDKDHRADVTAIKDVARQFGAHLNGYKIFVNKSTVPVGTGAVCRELIATEVRKRNAQHEFDVISNPEFLREGVAVADSLKPDRIVIGATSDRAVQVMKKLYLPIIEKGSLFFVTDSASAEIIKYASNALLATKISFMNEIAQLCERVGADITAVERGVGLDNRIGRRFLHAGIGFGGSCFPKDVDALAQTGRDNGYEFRIVRAVQEVNERQKVHLYEKLVQHIPAIDGSVVAVWGLAFKPKTDDMREAPSIGIIQKLLKAGARVQVFDPAAMDVAKKHYFPKIRYAKNPMEAVVGADALLLLTDWDEFRGVDFVEVKKRMRGALIGDGRNIWQPEEVRAAGFVYFSIGRP